MFYCMTHLLRLGTCHTKDNIEHFLYKSFIGKWIEREREREREITHYERSLRPCKRTDLSTLSLSIYKTSRNKSLDGVVMLIFMSGLCYDVKWHDARFVTCYQQK